LAKYFANAYRYTRAVRRGEPLQRSAESTAVEPNPTAKP
jgi:hypothetical protein